MLTHRFGTNSSPILPVVILSLFLRVSCVGNAAEPAVGAGDGGNSGSAAATECRDAASQTTTCAAVASARCKRERAFVMLKPDAVQRGLVAALLGRFEKKGAQLVAMKMVRPDRTTLEQHYQEHKGRPFFASLIEFMLSGPVVATVWEGQNIITIARSMLGATDPVQAAPGTIRGDYAASKEKNLCHVSDSPAAATAEIRLWFRPEEIFAWDQTQSSWLC